MASESSSAVLELNDADTEDTEAPSVTDDVHDGAPLIMEHGYDIAVKVDAPMKQLSTLETFVTYRVRCVCARWPTPPYVRRRYNHFKALHRRLSSAHALVAVPPLPPLHSARQQLDRYSPTFVAQRTLALNYFLDLVAKHPILTYNEDFRIFLTTPDEELDKVFRSENSALNLWGLSSALYGGSESKLTTNGARMKHPEFTSTADYLQALQQQLTTLCTLTSKLYKSSVALGNELLGMKRACDAWATQARGRCGRGAGAVAAGAGAQLAALGRLRPPHRARAALPLLAAYAGAHLDKIRLRDNIHAAHIGGNTTGDIHNRMEQASEALRSELSDWIPKTHSEIKSILLELADRQVGIYTQTLMGWEHALKLSTEANVDELFKTVSKTAVQNLSPSKCRPDGTPTETEKDFDDIEYSNDESEIDDDREMTQLNDGKKSKNHLEYKSEESKPKSESMPKSEESKSKSDGSKIEMSEPFQDLTEGEHIKNMNFDGDLERSRRTSDPLHDLSKSEEDIRNILDLKSEGTKSDVSKLEMSDPLQVANDAKKSDRSNSKSEPSKLEVLSDPLHDFSEVDLSS